MEIMFNFILTLVLSVFPLHGPVYTDILGHINCENASYERHTIGENYTLTMCRFPETLTWMFWSRWKNEDLNCVAYVNGILVECPPAKEVY